MNACLEFIDRIGRNPYHPVDPEDYPRLFDLEITPDGIVYFERLRAEWLSGADMSSARQAHLRALHLAYASARKSVDECRLLQAFVLLAGGGDGPDAADSAAAAAAPTAPASADDEARYDLVRMGCLRENAGYEPRLYKSHVLWRERKLADIEAFLNPA